MLTKIRFSKIRWRIDAPILLHAPIAVKNYGRHLFLVYSTKCTTVQNVLQYKMYYNWLPLRFIFKSSSPENNFETSSQKNLKNSFSITNWKCRKSIRILYNWTHNQLNQSTKINKSDFKQTTYSSVYYG